MRTTLDLDDALLVRAKEKAARQRTTLTRLIERGLARVLEESDEPTESPPFQWKVTEGGVCLRSDIDWTSNASIYAALDEKYDMRQAGLLPFRDPDDPAE